MKLFKPVLVLCFISSLFVSCNLLDHSVPDYLSNWASEIYIADESYAVSNYHEDKYHKNHVPSNNIDSEGKERFIFAIPYANPSSHELMVIDPDTGDGVPAAEADITASINSDDNLIYFYFKNSFLIDYDKEQPGKSRQFSKTYELGDTQTMVEGVFTKAPAKFSITFDVNTKPEILNDTNLTFGQIVENDTTKHVLCFDLKDPDSHPELYSDLKDDNGFYTISINGESYKFKWAGNKFTFTDTDKFFTSISDIVYPENNFAPGANTFFFKSNGTVNAFNIKVEDNYGLCRDYKVSTQPTGKKKVMPPTVNASGDCFTITPNFSTTGTNSQSLEKVIIKYKLNDENFIQKEFNSTDPAEDKTIKVYVPGGSWELTCFAQSQSSQINDSQYETRSLNPAKVVFVDTTQDNPDYQGATSDHAITMDKALTFLATQTGEWTMKIKSNIQVTSVSGNAFINLTNSAESFKLKITKNEDNQNTNRIIDLKEKGRAINVSGFPLTLEKIDITGGKLTSGNGAAVCSNKKITINNCNIYSNTTSANSAKGGAIYTTGDVSVTGHSLIHENSVTGTSANAGAIYAGGAVSVTGSEIYKNTTSSGNGGAIVAEGNISISSEKINGQTYYSKFYENKASSGSGGAIYCAKASSHQISITGSSKFYSNEAVNGGALYTKNQLTITSSYFYGNIASSKGGAVCLEGTNAYFTIASTEIGKNDSPNSVTGTSGKGGGIYLDTDNKTNASSISQGSIIGISGLSAVTSTPGNIADYGAGIYCKKTTANTDMISLILSGTTVMGNNSKKGGGIYCANNFTISGSTASTISCNTAIDNGNGQGGGIYLQDSVINSSDITISGNSANSGGGVYLSDLNNDVNANIAMATISGNNATGNGGGIYIANAGEYGSTSTTNFDNNGYVSGPQITGNTASGNGGGIYTYANATIKGVRVSSNTANNGGGVYSNGNLVLTYSKINTNGFDVNGNSKNGAGIYAASELQLSTRVNITDDNDVYLPSQEKLKLTPSNGVLFYQQTSATLAVTVPWADKFVLTANNQSSTFMKNVELSSSDYVLGPEYVIYQKSKHTPSTSKTFQQIIDGLSDTATETNPGIIVFTGNYTANENNWESKQTTNSSPAVFPSGSASSKKKFIIYGNTKTYSCNAIAMKQCSAMFVNENCILEINDLTIRSGQCLNADDTNQCGGAVYLKGNLTLRNVDIGFKIEASDANIWTSYNNIALKGGGIYVANGGNLIFETGGIYKGCTKAYDNNGSKGGGLYIENGGKAELQNIKIYGCQNQSSYISQGTSIYCEENGYLKVTNLDIQKCKNDYGTPGIYFEDKAIFDEGSSIVIKNNSSASSEKIGLGIHCAGKLYIVTSMSNLAQTFTGYNLSNTEGKVDFFLPTQIAQHYNGTIGSWNTVASDTYIWNGYFCPATGGISSSTFVIGFKNPNGSDYLKGTFVKDSAYGTLNYSSCSAFSVWE